MYLHNKPKRSRKPALWHMSYDHVTLLLSSVCCRSDWLNDTKSADGDFTRFPLPADVYGGCRLLYERMSVQLTLSVVTLVLAMYGACSASFKTFTWLEIVL